MSKNSGSKWKTCPECGVKLKTLNFEKHMERRHPNVKYEPEISNSRGSNGNGFFPKNGMSRSNGIRLGVVIISIITIAILIFVSINLLIENEEGSPNNDNLIDDPNPVNDDIDEPIVLQNTRIDKSRITDSNLHVFKYDSRSFFVHKNPFGNYKVRFIQCTSCKEQCQFPDKPMFSTVDGGAIINCDRCSTQWDSEYYTLITGSCEDGPPQEVITTEDSNFIYISDQNR